MPLWSWALSWAEVGGLESLSDGAVRGSSSRRKKPLCLIWSDTHRHRGQCFEIRSMGQVGRQCWDWELAVVGVVETGFLDDGLERFSGFRKEEGGGAVFSEWLR